MDLSSLSVLKKYFAKNSTTILFPILADLYECEGDLAQAKKVCKIGLDNHPKNVEGKYILAKLNKQENDFINSEKLLIELLEIDSSHYSALVMLAQVQQELDRAPSVIAKSWQKILEIDPTNTDAINYLNNDDQIKYAQSNSEEISVTKHTKIQDEGQNVELQPPSIESTNISEEEVQILNISPRMATFTLVRVLKNQKLYQQAMTALIMLEEKGIDRAQIKRERKSIEKLIRENK